MVINIFHISDFYFKNDLQTIPEHYTPTYQTHMDIGSKYLTGIAVTRTNDKQILHIE